MFTGGESHGVVSVMMIAVPSYATMWPVSSPRWRQVGSETRGLRALRRGEGAALGVLCSLRHSGHSAFSHIGPPTLCECIGMTHGRVMVAVNVLVHAIVPVHANTNSNGSQDTDTIVLLLTDAFWNCHTPPIHSRWNE